MIDSWYNNVKAYNKIFLLILVAGSCIGCDRLTKDVARNELKEAKPISYLGDVIRLQYEENQGAMFSVGSDLPERVRFVVFTVLMGFLLSGILMFVIINRRSTAGDIVTASLVVGGGCGNLLDRLLYNGSVIDFLNIGVGSIRTAIFNVADVVVIAGVVLFFVQRARRDMRSAFLSL